MSEKNACHYQPPEATQGYTLWPGFSDNLYLLIQDEYDALVTINLYALSRLYLTGSLEHIYDTGDTVLPAHNG